MPGPAFDAHRPPDAALAADCVHCGFCLPTCPTYVLWGEEMDSPRGRIHLMQQGLDGAPLSATMATHFDRCLGCMACVTACPSGVQYDRLIGATRAQVERRHPRTRRERLFRDLLFAVLPYPRRLRWLRPPLALAQRLGADRLARSSILVRRAPRIAALASMAPRVGRLHRLPARIRARGKCRGTVGLLAGCVQSAFFSEVNAATARVLAAEGFDVMVPPAQGCCGALSLHAGREPEGIAFARRTITAFEAAGVDAIVVNAAGCGSAMKEYGHLFEGDKQWQARAEAFAAKVRDLSEFLAGAGPRAPRQPVPLVAAYQDACHLAHAQGVTVQPRALLAAIPGLEVRELADAAICCGSAGVWNILHPGPAAELGTRKAGTVTATGATAVISANPGCLLQLQCAFRDSGQDVACLHIAQVLDASVSGTPLPEP